MTLDSVDPMVHKISELSLSSDRSPHVSLDGRSRFLRDFSLTLLATRHFVSCSIKSWHLSFTNPREAIFIILLTFSLLETSQVQGLSSQALIPRIPKTREVNRTLIPFSRRLVSTRQSHGSHQEILPRVLSCSTLGTSLLATWSTQPLGSYLANL